MTEKIRNKIIPALDVNVSQVYTLVDKLEETKSEIAGYKIGSLLVMRHGIEVLEDLKGMTDLPIIYDGQKFGTDIPDIIKKQVELLATIGIDQLIIAPQGAGRESLKMFTETCKEYHIEPICVVKMTHLNADCYLQAHVDVDIFGDAKHYGIKKFVFPATKPEILEIYNKIPYLDGTETLMATGFKVQGGKTEQLRDLGVTEFIVGRVIYQAKYPLQVVKDISEEINK